MKPQSAHLFNLHVLILMSVQFTATSSLPLSQVIDRSLQRLRSHKNHVTSGVGVQGKSTGADTAQISEQNPAGLGSVPDLSLPSHQPGPHVRSSSTFLSSTGLHSSTSLSSTGAHSSASLSSTGLHSSTSLSSPGAHSSTSLLSPGAHSSTSLSSPVAHSSTSLSSTGLQSDRLHPFLKSKRDRRHAECQHPSRLPERVLELNSYLSHSLLVGLDKEEEKPELPADQPSSDVCSSDYNPLLATAKEPNLRTTCPWVWENKDLGEDIYPTYVRTAHCLCDDCLGSTSLSCQSIDRNITVLKRDGCNNGLAVFEEVTRTVSVACGCAIPRMQL